MTAAAEVRTSAPAIDVDAILAKARTLTGAQPFRYRFSSAGEPCLRALVYDAQDADDGKEPPAESRKLSHLLSAVCGTAVGAHLEKAAALLGYETQKAHEFSTGGIVIRGSSDIAAPGCVLDLKLVGEKKWERVQKEPDLKHLMQVNGYAVQNDSPRWALLYLRGLTIFDGSEEPETLLHEGAASIELAQVLCGIWEDVEQHRKLRTLPERVFGAKPDGWPCAWCRHLERCAPEREEE